MVLDVNGIRLHWETSGRGEPLLWLHGGMGCGDDWRFIFHQAPEGFEGHRSETSAVTARQRIPAGVFTFRQAAH